MEYIHKAAGKRLQMLCLKLVMLPPVGLSPEPLILSFKNLWGASQVRPRFFLLSAVRTEETEPVYDNLQQASHT